MALAEFQLIERFFASLTPRSPHTRLSIGDDCALWLPPLGETLAITTDTLVENVHFFAGCDAEALGHKTLAVNLSDLASTGAKPWAVTLALTLPRVDETWLAAFSRGFGALARQFGVELIGGDTTRGPLSITVQALGSVPESAALRRDAARAGDKIYLTGQLGEAGLGLAIARGAYTASCPEALARLHRPLPRISAGLALRGVAHACIDVSDGLLADLGHILQRSGVGADLHWDHLPLSPAVLAYIDATGDWQMPLGAGDDYELCFTAPPNRDITTLALGVACREIGRITEEPGLRLYRAGTCHTMEQRGYEHFAS